MLLVTFFTLFGWLSRVVCCIGGGAVGRGWVGIGALEVSLEGVSGIDGGVESIGDCVSGTGGTDRGVEYGCIGGGVSGTDGGTDRVVEYGCLGGGVSV